WAALWAGLGGVGTSLGLMHAYQLSGNNEDYLLVGARVATGALEYRAYDVAAGYFIMAAIFLAMGWYWKGRVAAGETADAVVAEHGF
ncbi:MAG: hypothetical protein ACRDD1_16355, partial [Planctomycetia bacterium]